MTENRAQEYVLLASLVKAWENPREVMTLIEAHAPDCHRVTGNTGPRVVSTATGDPKAEVLRIARVVGETDQDARQHDQEVTTEFILAALALQNVDARCVTDDSGAYVELFGTYVGRCLRGRQAPCLAIAYGDTFGNLRPESHRPPHTPGARSSRG
jgi:hypothetical protein